MNQQISWLFFDLGSTLIDESDCAEYRTRELLKQPNAPTREVLEKRMLELAMENRLPYKDVALEYGLETVKWPSHLEKLYVDTPNVLEILKKKYHLGIIANQNMGTEQRLADYGILDYFDVIVSSAEAGVSKPDLQIFKMALTMANCMPQEAYMIGDRLDNDIEPAAEIGMNTIWVRQGSFAYGSVELVKYKPDHTVNSLVDVLQLV